MSHCLALPPAAGPVMLFCVQTAALFSLFRLRRDFSSVTCSSSWHMAQRKEISVAALLAESSLCVHLVLQQKEDLFVFPPSSPGNKHHQRGAGEQSRDRGRGSGPRLGDPENHRAVLTSARLQRGRPPHQRPGWGAHERKTRCLNT